MDYEGIQRCRDDDRKFFDEHPDREYRLRRGHDTDYVQEPPPGVRLFVALHRDEVEHYWRHHIFAAPVNFDTKLDDAQIGEILARAAA